jgi:hypothetical protein
MFGLDLPVGFLLLLCLFQGLELFLGQDDLLLDTFASRAFNRFLNVSRS